MLSGSTPREGLGTHACWPFAWSMLLSSQDGLHNYTNPQLEYGRSRSFIPHTLQVNASRENSSI
eukprot:6302654-Amphidinium_carterae.1